MKKINDLFKLPQFIRRTLEAKNWNTCKSFELLHSLQTNKLMCGPSIWLIKSIKYTLWILVSLTDYYKNPSIQGKSTYWLVILFNDTFLFISSSFGSLCVPTVVMMCIRHLEQFGMHTVGIFRVSSSKKRVRQVRPFFQTIADWKK